MKKVLLGSIVFVGLYNLLFYPTVLGIGIGLLFLFIHLYLYVVRSNKSSYIPLALLLSVLSIFFAACIGWRANGVVQFLDLLITLALTLAAGYFYKKDTAFSPGFFFFTILPLSAFVESVISVNNFFSQHKLKKPSENQVDIFNGIFRGVVITIPIIIVLFFLLLGADPIFKELVGKISFTISEQLVLSIIIFIICFAWGITTIKDKLGIKNFNDIVNLSGENLDIESLIVTFATATLFAVFLIVQLRYLFLQVPETELQNLGINIQTYSEYVRQGFFQLLFAAAIASSIIVFILQSLHTNIKHKLYLKIGMLLLTLETQFLLVSAWKRLFLYEQAHGLTRSRIFGFIFLLWLSLLLAILFISALKKIKQTYFFTGMFVITIMAFTAINIVPIDYIIARYYPPTVNKQIDYEYITGLSPEASVVWTESIIKMNDSWQKISLVQIPTDEEMRMTVEIQRVLSKLNNHIYFLDRKYGKNPQSYTPINNDQVYLSTSKNIRREQGKWQAFNFSEFQAYQIIQHNRIIFSQVKLLLDDIVQKQNLWSSQR